MAEACYALVDCNNFFVSCERIFQPDLNGVPVVVLSSNDGCAVARSSEAKALGIPMGAPAFKYRELFQRQQVVQFSANFELYGDISARLVQLLRSLTPQIEVYSIDESFLDLSELGITNYRAWGEKLRRRIWREIGLPVSVGVAPTKTLAKLAADRAKKDAALQGVLSFVGLPDWLIDPQLAATPIEDLWGIGWRLSPRLRAAGLHNALQLKQLSLKRASQLMGVHGRQMTCELQGIRCLEITRAAKPRQSIMHGRMFGTDTANLQVVEAAVASLMAQATRSLRREGLVAGHAQVVVSTNRHRPGYRRFEASLHTETPSADAGQLTAALFAELSRTIPAGQQLHRALVSLYDLTPATRLQIDVFGSIDPAAYSRNQARLQAIDTIGARFGVARIGYAAEKLSDQWLPKRGQRSSRYTTQWNELPTAHLGTPP